MSDVNAVVETLDKKMKEGDHFSPTASGSPNSFPAFTAA